MAQGDEFIVLSGSMGESFNRSVRDKDGNILETLTFQRGVPFAIQTDAQAEAIADDIGAALLIAVEQEADPKHKGQAPKIIVDSERTDEVILKVAQRKKKAGSELTLAQQRAWNTFCESQPEDKLPQEDRRSENSTGQTNPDCGECDPTVGQDAQAEAVNADEPVEETEGETEGSGDETTEVKRKSRRR